MNGGVGISMSKNVPTSAKKDGKALYGVFVVLALLPSVFSFAFGLAVQGSASDRTWLMAVFAFVLLVAARFIPAAAHRSGLFGAGLVAGVAVLAGVIFCRDMAGLLGLLGVHTTSQQIAPIGLALMYGGFAAFMGALRSQQAIYPADRRVTRVRDWERVSR
jgi:hypothetical protein